MQIIQKKITIESKTRIEFRDITPEVSEIVQSSGIRNGFAVVFAPHSTMGVRINHNEPLLIQDFIRLFYKFAPVDEQYGHDMFELKKDVKSDGRSNGHSHCKSLLAGVSETILIEKGNMLLGPRQSIFAIDFDGSRRRDILVHVFGE